MAVQMEELAHDHEIWTRDLSYFLKGWQSNQAKESGG
jgi:hypothetical protein